MKSRKTIGLFVIVLICVLLVGIPGSSIAAASPFTDATGIKPTSSGEGNDGNIYQEYVSVPYQKVIDFANYLAKKGYNATQMSVYDYALDYTDEYGQTGTIVFDLVYRLTKGQENIYMYYLIEDEYLVFCYPQNTGASSTARSQSTANNRNVSQNTMTAVINGEQKVLQLESAKVSNKKIFVTYTAYTPRGKKDVSVQLTFAESITPGTYSIYDADGKFEVKCDSYSAKYNAPNPYSSSGGFSMDMVQKRQEYHGNYSLNLTYRSSDWSTYQGSFSATLINSFATDQVVIEDAFFDFSF